MVLNVPPNQVITCEEDRGVMKKQNIVDIQLGTSSCSDKFGHWKEVHCKAIYKKAIYDKHEKQFQRKITYAMVTLVKWKGKFANISQEFKKISMGHMMRTFEDS
ncbi:unnamed protein product [Rhizophagus irregularis]|nr:unnamed protein product [Rhizophagus irregularis]